MVVNHFRPIRAGCTSLKYGGVDDAGNLVGASALYLDKRVVMGGDGRKPVCVMAAGGGAVAAAEFKHALLNGADCAYFRSEAKNAVYDNAVHGPVEDLVMSFQ